MKYHSIEEYSIEELERKEAEPGSESQHLDDLTFTESLWPAEPWSRPALFHY